MKQDQKKFLEYHIDSQKYQSIGLRTLVSCVTLGASAFALDVYSNAPKYMSLLAQGATFATGITGLAYLLYAASVREEEDYRNASRTNRATKQ